MLGSVRLSRPVSRQGSAVARLAPALIVTAIIVGPARAAPPPADDALFRVREGGAVTVDAGLVLALPVALGRACRPALARASPLAAAT